MRPALAVTVAFALSLQCFGATAVRHHNVTRHWRRDNVSGRGALRATAGAAIGQAFDSPRQWGRGSAGFGKRVGSMWGKHAVKTAVEFPVAAVRHEDLRYHRSNQRGFGKRLRHALVSTIVTRKTTTGKRTVASGRISGNVAAGFISRLWQPVALHTAASGASSAGIGLGADAAANIVQEFWPRHPRRARHRPRRG
jgi:hypothetical protein